MFRATEPHLEHTFFVTFPTKRQSFHRAFFCAEICTISAQNPQCLHKSLHQNQTKKAHKCDKGHVATKARKSAQYLHKILNPQGLLTSDLTWD